MKYKTYKKICKKLHIAKELERLLQYAQDDFENINDRQYFSLKYCILKKIMTA